MRFQFFAGVLALLAAGVGCVHKPILNSYRLLRQDSGEILVPPGVARPDLTRRTFIADIATGKGICAAEGGIQLQPVRKKLRVSVDRDALLQQRQPRWLADWSLRAEEQGCIAQGRGQDLAELIVEFECWSIAFPGLNVFKVALNAAAYDVRQSFPPLFAALLQILPMDPPPGETGKPTIIHPPPSPEVLSALKRLTEQYKAAVDEIGCYIYDLTVEAQNNLLHGLFEGTVPPRRPLDPRRKVISTVPETAQALIRYFETETAWGKNQAAINAEVVAEVQAKAASQSASK